MLRSHSVLPAKLLIVSRFDSTLPRASLHAGEALGSDYEDDRQALRPIVTDG
jgi:hypothetical protein